MIVDYSIPGPVRAGKTTRTIAALNADIKRLQSLLAMPVNQTVVDNQRLRDALQALHDDVAEYQRINNIGGYDNHAMVQARTALSGKE